MAREIILYAELNFTFDNHSEMTSLRSSAETFATNNSGTFTLSTKEDASGVIPYYGKLNFTFPVASRSQANTRMTAIDNALSGLPDLVTINGKQLEYNMQEREIP